MKPACRMPCWTGTTGEKLHDSIFNFSFVTVSSGMHLQSSLMMMMMMIYWLVILYITFTVPIYYLKAAYRIPIYTAINLHNIFTEH